MASPTILIDSATGSDSGASGAGPSSPLTGTAASTSGDGLTVTLDGSPDLTNVATDGSHVIFLDDSTAGARNFGKITGKNNSTKTVTVANAFGLSLSGKTWAIGGKRASIYSTASRKLLVNNSGVGDANGWTIEFSSGHSESTGSSVTLKASVQFQASSGYTVRPILTGTHNGAMFTPGGAYDIRFQGIEFRNTNATKTASSVIEDNYGSSLTYTQFTDCLCAHATDKFSTFIYQRTAFKIIDCTISTDDGAIDYVGTEPVAIVNSAFHSCGGSYAVASSRGGALVLAGCIFAENTGGAVNIESWYGDQYLAVRECVFHDNGASGLRIDTPYGPGNNVIMHCMFTENGAYGINLIDSGGTNCVIRDNAFRSNVSGNINNDPGSPHTHNSISLTADPYVDAASKNYNLNSTAGGGAALRSEISSLPSTSTDLYLFGAFAEPEASAPGPSAKSLIIGSGVRLV